ncbi:MAG: hypothetical protein WD733_00940 [Bryobacterales bacterium]
MLGATKLRGFLLTAALVLAILPVRPLIVAFGAQGSAAQKCLLHGSDCQCAAHCDRTGRHSPEAHEAAAKPACHRDTAADEPRENNLAEPGDRAPASASDCAMTSCNKDAPLLLTSQGLPSLAASDSVELYRHPGFEAVRAGDPFARFSLEASPPTPPPES